MKRAATVALALGAMIGAGLSPATAQVVIGGSDEADVQVNWSVIDRLGPAPNLADMLKSDIHTNSHRVAPSRAKSEKVTFRPYVEPKKTAAAVRKAAAVAAKPKPAEPVAVAAKAEPVAVKNSEPVAVKHPEPVVAKAEPVAVKHPEPVVAKTPESAPAVAELAQAAQAIRAEAKAAKPAPIKAEPRPSAPPPKPVIADIPAPVAPKVSLPETPVPAPVVAKAEPVKPEPVKPAPKPEPVAAPAPKPEPAPAPAPVAAPAPKPEPVPTPAPQMAAVAPAPAPVAPVIPARAVAPIPAPASTGGDTLSIAFAGENATLSDATHPDLLRIAARLEKEDSLNLQLLAYAEGDESNASKARRLSLSRALAVRQFLMEQGVRSTRIEVRALGNKSDGGPADRVDAILVAR